MTAITTAAHIDAQTQEELMRQAGIWIEHSTLIEDDLPARPLAAVQAEKHQLDRYTQLVADRAAARAPQCLAQIEEPAKPARIVLDDNWKARMLDGRAPERDEMGLGDHPELPWLDEGMMPRSFFAALGLELAHTSAEDQLDGDVLGAMSEAVNWSRWMPTAPQGDGWKLVSIFDTEDGPVAWWLRELPEAEDGTTTIRNLKADVEKLEARIARLSRAGAAPAAVAPQDVVAWMHPETLNVISAAHKHDMSTEYGAETRRKAESHSVALVRAGEPAVAAPALEAPPAVAPQGEYPHEQMDAMALARYKVVPSHASMLWSHAVVAGDGAQQLYVGREVECQNMARKFAGAFLDGAFAFHSMAAAPTAQAAPALEAPGAREVTVERYEIPGGMRSALEDVISYLRSHGRRDLVRLMQELSTAISPWDCGSCSDVPDALVPARPDAEYLLSIARNHRWPMLMRAHIKAAARLATAPALEAPAAPACDEEAAYKKWFQGEQGKPYHTMWDFARAAWMARAALAAAPQAPAAPVEPDIDRVMALADLHADDSREDGARIFDRGGLVALAQDVLRIFAPEAAPAAPAVDAPALGEWVATLEVDSEGGLDYETVPPCTLPPGCYRLYRAAQAKEGGAAC